MKAVLVEQTNRPVVNPIDAIWTPIKGVILQSAEGNPDIHTGRVVDKYVVPERPVAEVVCMVVILHIGHLQVTVDNQVGLDQIVCGVPVRCSPPGLYEI